MRAGQLRHRITLEAPEETVTAGKPTIPWPVKATVWGRMEGLAGVAREGITADATVRFLIRYRADINARWRVGLVGTARKFLQVVPPMDPDGRRTDLILVTQEDIK